MLKNKELIVELLLLIDFTCCPRNDFPKNQIYMIIISYKWTYGLSGNDYIVATFFIGSDGSTYVRMDLQT